jgi:hypothetical protein
LFFVVLVLANPQSTITNLQFNHPCKFSFLLA